MREMTTCPECGRMAYANNLYVAVHPQTGQLMKVCAHCEDEWAGRPERQPVVEGEIARKAGR